MKIVINVTNNEEKIKFLKKIKYFRMSLFKIFSFEYTGNDEEIKEIVYALNIKNNRKRVEYIYDNVCDKIDKKFEGINICGFNCGKCYAQQKGNRETKNGCCAHCAYQSSDGCKTKNISCKLFFCEEVTSRHKVVRYKEINLLKCFGIRQQIISRSSFFLNREEIVRCLAYKSLFLSTFTNAINGIKNIKYNITVK